MVMIPGFRKRWASEKSTIKIIDAGSDVGEEVKAEINRLRSRWVSARIKWQKVGQRCPSTWLNMPGLDDRFRMRTN
jgi:hypothetical protein